MILRFIYFQINELKKSHQAGGRAVFTWQKQDNDKFVNAIALGIAVFGLCQVIPGFYRLSSGKGKME
jgi:hypothetical protein